ncbi:MAG: alpha/beta hydrolase family protein [Terracidiphilus sp.]
MKIRWNPRGSWLLAVAAGIALAGCGGRAPRLLDHPQLAPGVTLRDVSFASKALGRTVTYRVLLPEKPLPGRGLPVVYLLHGGGGGYRDWSNYSGVAAWAAPERMGGLILVMPEGDSSYFMNEAGAPSERYEDFLTSDLVADVEARFPAAQDRAHRAIVGASMGGFAAVKLALTRPDLYVFAGALSPAIDVPSRKFSWRRWAQSLRFRRIFGPEGSPARRAADPFVLVRTADPARTPFLYLTAGEKEALLEANRRFAELLKQRGFRYEFHTRPGGHDWNQWDAQTPGCFERLAGWLGGKLSAPGGLDISLSGGPDHSAGGNPWPARETAGV